jgi:hypothetical protein
MADPLTVSSALVAIVTATVQSSRLLYQTVQSFKNHQRVILQLKDELHALGGVLESLQEAVDREDPTLAPLKLPLLRCRQACIDFQELMVRCSARSGGSRTSFRDWAKLRYMDSDIADFTSMLAGYKSTITIALTDANLLVSLSQRQARLILDQSL